MGRHLLFVLLLGGISCTGLRAASVDQPTLGQPASILPGATQVVELRPDGSTSLAAALSGIAQWRIAPGAHVVFRLADGTYRQGATLRVEHPDGARIQIVGNVDAPSQVRLVWPARTDAIHVGSGQVLGGLDGVTILRNVPGGNDNGAADNAIGLLAENAGVLQAGPAVVVDGFYYGAQARFGGVLRVGGTVVLHAGDAGFFAYNGGHVEAREARAEDTSDAKLGLGSGFVAEYGGTIDASGARSTNNALAGFTALSGGAIVANGATASNNRRYGLYANTNGSIVAHRASVQKNATKETFEEAGGSISGLDK
jgi:hypothetical protein